MRFVYVLEDDLKFQKEIVEAIQFIDPKIQIRVFSKLESFSEWIKDMMVNGSASISNAGQIPQGVVVEAVDPNEKHQLVCIISKIEYLGKKQLPLLKKTKDMLVKRGICTAEDPTAFVLTSFEAPDFKIRDLEDRILNNVIFKPFDKLILVQHLTFAIDGRHKASKYTIANQKASATIEMLKEVNVECVSEVGFTTRSEQEFPVGSFSKYYGKIFATERLTSSHAVLTDCRPHPASPKEFQLTFSFFGMDPSQVNSLRRKIKEKKYPLENVDWKQSLTANSFNDPQANVVVIDDNSYYAKAVIETIQRRFLNTKITAYPNFHEFLVDIDPKMAEENGKKYPKAINGIPEIEVHFDSTLTTIKAFGGKLPPHTVFVTQKISDVIKDKSYWLNLLGKERIEKWLAWLRKPQEGHRFDIMVGDDVYYMKPTSIKAEKDDVIVTFTDLSPAERLEYLTQNSRLPKDISFIIAGHRYFQSKPEEQWPKLLEKLKDRGNKYNSQIFIMASREYSDQEKKTLSGFVKDIFYAPLDRAILVQKLQMNFPFLSSSSEQIEYPTMRIDEIIHAASPVKISEISEAGLVLEYHRPLEIGSFRTFILWQPYEVAAPNLAANCNFVEEVSKGQFSIHFVFFGISEQFLKNIRLWIRESYVHSKEQSG